MKILPELARTATMTALKPVSLHTHATNTLLQGIGKNRADHSVLRENLEHYNSQLESPISDLWETADMAAERKPEDMRWIQKIHRDVSQPYSDSDVAQHLGQLDSELVDLVRVGRLAPSACKGSKFPSKMYVAGGVGKGRFGANSDLDVLGEGLLSDRSCEHLAAKVGWKVHKTVDEQGQTVAQSVHSPAGVNAQFLQSADFQKVAKWYGAHFVVDVESAKQGDSGLPAAVIQGFEDKGLEAKLDAKALSLRGDGPIVRESEEKKTYPDVQTGNTVAVAGRSPSSLEKFQDWLSKS